MALCNESSISIRRRGGSQLAAASQPELGFYAMAYNG